MNIVIWNECYTSGGADWSLIDLVESWPSKNDSFIIYVNKTHEGLNLIRSKTQGKAVVKEYTSFMELVWKLRETTFLGKLGVLGKLISWILIGPISLISYINYVNRKNCDVLILNNGGYPGGLSNYIIAFWAWVKRIPKRVMIVRNYPIKTYQQSLKMKLFKTLCETFLTKIVTVSNSLKRSMIEQANIKEDLVQKIYNGINIQNKSSKASASDPFKNFQYLQKRVGIIGNLEERKGHDVLFKAWKEVIQKHPDANLFVIGSSRSGDKNRLENLAQNLGISQNIHWIEFLSEVGSAYQFLDLVVMPSRNFESFGRIVVEAMAFETPIIGSRVGGIPELIEDGIDGKLFVKDDHQELSKNIISLLDSPETREKLAKNGIEKYRTLYTSDVMAKNYFNSIQ